MKSIQSKMEKFTDRESDKNGCLNWIGAKNADGYGVVDYKGRKHKAHRVAYELANRCEIPSGMFILHSCDNPPCVNPAHLRLGTHMDNVIDRDSKDRVCHGSTHPSARLTEWDVFEILRRLSTGESARKIAASFPVGRTTVDRIKSGGAWKRLDRAEKPNPVST